MPNLWYLDLSYNPLQSITDDGKRRKKEKKEKKE
jgi:hypothetical protein